VLAPKREGVTGEEEETEEEEDDVEEEEEEGVITGVVAPACSGVPASFPAHLVSTLTVTGFEGGSLSWRGSGEESASSMTRCTSEMRPSSTDPPPQEEVGGCCDWCSDTSELMVSTTTMRLGTLLLSSACSGVLEFLLSVAPRQCSWSHGVVTCVVCVLPWQ
jgi:hypothetical protein